jgi:hypothetical protein
LQRCSALSGRLVAVTDAPLAVTIAADTVAHPRMSRINLDTEVNMTPLWAVHKLHGGLVRAEGPFGIGPLAARRQCGTSSIGEKGER